ncbi:PHP domain-containing protein [Saccharicrinis aurantiacus]|uniref:PHP domain-containing protein n=1 Tax=Saccharicrinis aurantiacus TaxID=1849719 RepID=UPI002492E6BC|nr:PHP domain-containing protein [Saccharicrinis aurantiacus]
MKNYRADLHIHTVLSPCASLDMSPDNIIKEAIKKKLDIIGITDHNSTKQCKVVDVLGKKNGIKVLLGVEVSSKEEVHCLAYFESYTELALFQEYIDQHLPYIKNQSKKFGDQVWVNQFNEIIGIEERLLIVGLKQTIDEIAIKVKELSGIFIPAHINKARNSLISQLGFMPTNLSVNAIEVFKGTDIDALCKLHKWAAQYSILTNSDAHELQQIGQNCNNIQLEAPTFQAIKETLKKGL